MTDQERDKILEEINKNVNELLIWKSALDVRCEGHRKDTTEVRATVYGNPGSTSGLQFEVTRLVNGGKNRSRWRDFWVFVLRSCLVAAIIGIGICLLRLFKINIM